MTLEPLELVLRGKMSCHVVPVTIPAPLDSFPIILIYGYLIELVE